MDVIKLTAQGSPEETEILDIIQGGCLYQSQSNWKVGEVSQVNNADLQQDFRSKKQELVQMGCSEWQTEEWYAYTIDRKPVAQSICRNGYSTRSKDIQGGKFLIGDPSKGVIVNKHSDVCLGWADLQQYSGQVCMVVYKVMLGRARYLDVSPRWTHIDRVQPTEGYDCHLSKNSPSSNDTLQDAVANSKIYLYEENEKGFSTKPSQCVPIALVSFWQSSPTGFGKTISQGSRSWENRETMDRKKSRHCERRPWLEEQLDRNEKKIRRDDDDAQKQVSRDPHRARKREKKNRIEDHAKKGNDENPDKSRYVWKRETKDIIKKEHSCEKTSRKENEKEILDNESQLVSDFYEAIRSGLTKKSEKDAEEDRSANGSLVRRQRNEEKKKKSFYEVIRSGLSRKRHKGAAEDQSPKGSLVKSQRKKEKKGESGQITLGQSGVNVSSTTDIRSIQGNESELEAVEVRDDNNKTDGDRQDLPCASSNEGERKMFRSLSERFSIIQECQEADSNAILLASLNKKFGDESGILPTKIAKLRPKRDLGKGQDMGTKPKDVKDGSVKLKYVKDVSIDRGGCLNRAEQGSNSNPETAEVEVQPAKNGPKSKKKQEVPIATVPPTCKDPSHTQKIRVNGGETRKRSSMKERMNRKKDSRSRSRTVDGFYRSHHEALRAEEDQIFEWEMRLYTSRARSDENSGHGRSVSSGGHMLNGGQPDFRSHSKSPVQQISSTRPSNFDKETSEIKSNKSPKTNESNSSIQNLDSEPKIIKDRVGKMVEKEPGKVSGLQTPKLTSVADIGNQQTGCHTPPAQKPAIVQQNHLKSVKCEAPKSNSLPPKFVDSGHNILNSDLPSHAGILVLPSISASQEKCLKTAISACQEKSMKTGQFHGFETPPAHGDTISVSGQPRVHDISLHSETKDLRNVSPKEMTISKSISNPKTNEENQSGGPSSTIGLLLEQKKNAKSASDLAAIQTTINILMASLQESEHEKNSTRDSTKMEVVDMDICVEDSEDTERNCQDLFQKGSFPENKRVHQVVPPQNLQEVPSQNQQEVPSQNHQEIPFQNHCEVLVQNHPKVPSQNHLDVPSQKHQEVPSQTIKKLSSQDHHKVTFQDKKFNQMGIATNVTCPNPQDDNPDLRHGPTVRRTAPDTAGKFHGRTLLRGKQVPPRLIPLKVKLDYKPEDPRVDIYPKRDKWIPPICTQRPELPLLENDQGGKCGKLKPIPCSSDDKEICAGSASGSDLVKFLMDALLGKKQAPKPESSHSSQKDVSIIETQLASSKQETTDDPCKDSMMDLPLNPQMSFFGRENELFSMLPEGETQELCGQPKLYENKDEPKAKAEKAASPILQGHNIETVITPSKSPDLIAVQPESLSRVAGQSKMPESDDKKASALKKKSIDPKMWTAELKDRFGPKHGTCGSVGSRSSFNDVYYGRQKSFPSDRCVVAQSVPERSGIFQRTPAMLLPPSQMGRTLAPSYDDDILRYHYK